MLIGLVALLSCWLAGEALVSLLNLPLPGNVAGMLLLLVISFARRGVETRTAAAGSSLLSHMALLFVPAGVGLIEHSSLLAHQGIAMFAVLALSTAITMGVTAITLKWLLGRRKDVSE